MILKPIKEEKTMYEDDFVKEETVELPVEGRTGFIYKPTTAGDENDWLEEYTEVKEFKDDTGSLRVKYVTNLSKLNECKMRNLVEVPYDNESIAKITGSNKVWTKMSKEERWKMLKKLKPSVFNAILEAIKEVDNPPKKKD
jgi:hypothetical protein